MLAKPKGFFEFQGFNDDIDTKLQKKMCVKLGLERNPRMFVLKKVHGKDRIHESKIRTSKVGSATLPFWG